MNDSQMIGLSVRFNNSEELERARKFLNEYVYFFKNKIEYGNKVENQSFKMLEPTFILRFDIGSETSGDLVVKFEVTNE